MARQIMQFRYYGDNNEKNYPRVDIRSSLISGSLFEEYTPIIQLGVQSFPGTQFYLNNSNTEIIIGSTGIYELDLEGYAEISHMHFDEKSLAIIDERPNAYLIIDIISELKEDN